MDKKADKRNLTETHIGQFKKICGAQYVITNEEELNNYAHDQTEKLHFLPAVVLKVRSAEEISEVLKICNEDKIPVTPRGAGTGLSGGALPDLGGVLIYTERMNSIL